MRRRNILLAVLSLALVLSLAWGFNQYSIARELTIEQQNQYQQAYRDMTGHADNLENFLAKTMGSASNSNNLIHLTGAWTEANAALNDLSNLPVDNPGAAHLAQFFNQAADFSFVLAQRVSGGGSIRPEEQKALVDLHETARKTVDSLQSLQDKQEYEDLTWTAAKPTLWTRVSNWFTGRAEAGTTDADTQPASVAQGLQMLDSQLQKLPPFSYEGKFSSKVSQQPKGLPSEQVTKDQAQKNLQQFLSQVGLKYNFKYTEEAKGLIPTYRFNVDGNNNVTAEISKAGGIPVVFDDQREFGERTLSPEQAKAKAVNYLKAVGYPNMVLTSAEDYGAYMTLAYVAEQDGVKIYPDKVIVRIAMDNGQLVGYNARPYLMFHHDRSIGKAKLSVAQARTHLKPNFKVTDTALVLLAKDDYSEILCYEFRGTIDSEEYLSYINVSSGFEEQLYRVIKTPVGEYLK